MERLDIIKTMMDNGGSSKDKHSGKLETVGRKEFVSAVKTRRTQILTMHASHGMENQKEEKLSWVGISVLEEESAIFEDSLVKDRDWKEEMAGSRELHYWNPSIPLIFGYQR